MRRTFIFACALMTLCAAAVVRGVDRAIVGIARGIDYLLSAMPAAAPRFALSGEPVPFEHSSGYADPNVERHEAGISRRAAARHI